MVSRRFQLTRKAKANESADLGFPNRSMVNSTEPLFRPCGLFDADCSASDCSRKSYAISLASGVVGAVLHFVRDARKSLWRQRLA